MNITLIKQLNGSFKPAYPSDHDTAKKIKVGEAYEYKYTKPRNVLFHRKFFALIKMVFENQERYNNIEYLRKDLTIEAGYYDETPDLHGTMIKRAKSIAFDKMEEDEFSELYEKVLDQICIHFEFEREDVRENIHEFF